MHALEVSIFAAILQVSGIARAELYRCEVDGTVSFQEAPCLQAKAPGVGIHLKPSSQANRARAEELRSEQTRQRELLQKGFAEAPKPAPTPAAIVSRSILPSGLTQAQVCKAAVSAIMNRSPEIISIDREINGITYLSYRRPSDNSLWSQKCKLEQSTVHWGLAAGRWQNTYTDNAVTFNVTSISVVIHEQHKDGTASSNTFRIDQL